MERVGDYIFRPCKQAHKVGRPGSQYFLDITSRMLWIGITADADYLQVALFGNMPCQLQDIITRFDGNDIHQQIFFLWTHIKLGYFKPFLTVKEQSRIKNDINITMQ